MQRQPISLNLALIVYRVLTDERGWEVEELKTELDISARTYRKYRKILTESFPPFAQLPEGYTIAEVREEGRIFIRLLHERGGEAPVVRFKD